MERVVIIGCPGAGKTFLSRQIAEKTGLPLIHLDKIFHDKHFDYLNDKQAWLNKVKQLIKGKRWIIEGNYKSTFGIRLPAADTIIFMDYPRRMTIWRTLKRRVQYHNKVRPEMPEGWKEKIDWQFFKYVLRYQSTERRVVYEMLKEYRKKDVIILTSPNETKQFLKTLL